MDDPRKTKAQLLEELAALRNHVQVLEAADNELRENSEVYRMSASLIRDAAGKSVGFRGISWDVTGQKAAEADLERYRAFVENLEDGCFESDLAGNITFINDPGCRRFGYSREEFIGRNNRQYTSPETAQRAYVIFSEIYRTAVPAKIFDYEVIDRDGTKRFIDMSVSLMRDASGKPIGFRGTSRDVMDRKRLEAEKEKMTEQLNRAGKLEAVGTLAGGIAHDFNNLFMGIQGYASLMMLDLDPAHPYFERLKAIEGQVRIGAELTKQLSGFARGGRYTIASTDLNELIDKTADLFGRMKKNIRIHRHYTQPLRLVEADRGQIEQVLMSLFMNASEAMPGGGTLLLETADVRLDESFDRPYDLKFGPYVKISVTDTGVGMDEKTRERIFEPFFTTKEMGRGVGLGLAPVYGIIKGHGGLIEVSSEKGEGTTFTIYLPASPEEI